MEREYYCKSNDDHQLQSPACPRCGSLNTKFCYYNNYSLTQPRYFCKGCRRYWTKGGSLRNVPIGGGCRKSRRGRTAAINNRVVSITDGGGGSIQPTTNNSVSSGDHHNHGSTSTSIDLAAVYANFLNHQQPPPPRQPPENINQIDHLPPLPDGILVPLIEFSGFQGLPHDQEINNIHGFFECGSSFSTDNPRLLMSPESSTPPSLGGGSSNMFFDGLFQKHAGKSSFTGGIMLPPLPGDYVVAGDDSNQGMLWPDSDGILPATHHETDRAAAGEDGGRNSEVMLSANLSPFSDGLNLEAIFRS